MGAPLYDEFGNYIGSEAALENSESSASSDSESEGSAPGAALVVGDQASSSLVVPEPVGDVADIMMVEEEDAQPITVPIVEPQHHDTFNIQGVADLGFDNRYLEALRGLPELCRSVAVIGDLHHGKTCLSDLLVGADSFEATAASEVRGPERSTLRSEKVTAHTRNARFTDTRLDEQERGISIKACPFSVVRPNVFGKHYLLNVMDTPGHTNFIDEAAAGLRLCDGAVICVDTLMGPGLALRKQLEVAAREGLNHFVLCLNGFDRLILEVRLPPVDAYYKFRNVLNEMNELVHDIWSSLGLDAPAVFDPAAGNVVFSSAKYSCIFSLLSFAQLHVEKKLASLARAEPRAERELGREVNFDVESFSHLLWGDLWFHPETRKFQKTKPDIDVEDEDDEVNRTFVDFVLKPLYKIFAHVVGEEKPTLKPTLAEIGVHLDDALFSLDTPTLLKLVCSILFPQTQALVSAIVEHVPSSKANARRRVICGYTGSLDTPLALDLLKMNENATHCVVHTAKNFHRPNAMDTFDSFGRVFCGTLKVGDKVKVLGERYRLDDDEDASLRTVGALWILQGRFRVQVETAPAGSWVLIGGIGEAVLKTATIISLPVGAASEAVASLEIFRPLFFPARNVVRVACEPIASSDLPKMIQSLRQVAKSYPSVETLVEDSGAHVLICAGELAADCALYDLRKLYSGGDLEIRCADPVPLVCETVIGRSYDGYPIQSPNKKNQFTVICEPLEESLSKDLAAGLVSSDIDESVLQHMLKDKYEWDLLAARSFWAFASDGIPSALINDILPSRTETKREDVNVVKELVVHGFQWVTREGPLIEEEVRNVKFKLIDATVALREPLQRGSGQIIPTVRRAAYAGLMAALPRLMEPILMCEILAPADCVTAVNTVLSRRRGHIVHDKPIPATPLEVLTAAVPAIDSFGLETDIRTHTRGQAFVQSIFDTWETLPGDPLDASIVLRPLEPSPVPHLAREFLLKTRRRKGLSEDVTLTRFTAD